MDQSASSNKTYLLVINGKPEGPFTFDELKERKIQFNDFVRSAGMDDYKEAHEITELREYFGFDRQHVIPQYFAGFDQRLLASALDWLLILGVFISLTVVALVLVHDKQTQIIIAFSMLGIAPLAKLIYHIVMESSARQATYGKQVLKIKVCDMNGERISTGRSISRNCAKLLSVLTLFTGYLFSFFNRQQQCLHDMVARTLVIKDRLI